MFWVWHIAALYVVKFIPSYHWLTVYCDRLPFLMAGLKIYPFEERFVGLLNTLLEQ